MIISESDDIAFHPLEKAGMRHGLHRAGSRLARWLDEEEAWGVRFLFVPVFSGTGAIIYFSLGSEPSWGQLFLFAAFSAGLAFLFRYMRALSLRLCFCCFRLLAPCVPRGKAHVLQRS